MKIRTLHLVLVFFIGLQTLNAQTYYRDYQDGLVVFQLKPDVRKIPSTNQKVDFRKFPIFANLLADYDIVEVKHLHPDLDDELLNRTYQIQISDFSKVDDLAKVMNVHPDVEYAELKALHYSTYTPNDPGYSQNDQWGLFQIQAADAWDISLGSSNIVVAITDDAMQMNHPDLQNVFVAGRDMHGNDNDPSPCGTNDGFHGTHVSGTAGAQTNNGVGLASIGAGISLMPVKIGNCSNQGLPYGYEGVVWAANNGADIINMSWGSSSGGNYGQNVINNAWNQGVILVAAAGNDGNNSPLYPAAYNNVISVANTRNNDTKAPSSQYGSTIDIAAPGTNILSTVPTSSYDYASGTSMASPLVSGLLGLMKSFAPSASRQDLIDCLLNTADPMPSDQYYNNGQLGSGRINAYQAMLCLMSYTNEYDVAIGEIIMPNNTVCSGSFTPQIEIKNLGSITLTSATITYDWGGATKTYNWSGSLSSGQTDLVTLPAISLTNGNYVFTATVSSPNGQADENPSNNSATSNFVINTNGEEVTLNVTVDCWGEETTWEIKDDNNNVVASGGPYEGQAGGTLNTYTFCLPPGCYSFTIFDQYGDGLSGAQYQTCSTNGNFEMFDELGNLLFQMQETNGNFGSSSTHDFCISSNVVNDAGVNAIVSPTGIVCSSDILPEVEIKNYGSATLTSVDIVYDIGGNQQTYNWTGSLNTGQTQLVTLPIISVGTGQVLTVQTQNPNGNADENPTNDQKQVSLVLQVTAASLPFVEDFENSAVGWMVSNPDGATTWTLATVGGTTPGSTAAKMNFFGYQDGGGQRDRLISPKISLNGYSSAEMYFEHAFRRYNQTSSDSLIIYVSANCGASWTRVFQATENGSGTFATQTTSTAEFTPSTNTDWCIAPINQQTPGASCFTINLDAFVGNEIMVMFEAYKGGSRGNNLYIDNINITGVAAGNTPEPNFTTDVNQICEGDGVQFTDASTENPTSWNWTFPGGSPATSTSQNPYVTYNTSGTYDVILEVTNQNGTQTHTFTNEITVTSSPIVTATASETTICEGESIVLTANGANTYTWDNGLGSGNTHTVSPTTTTTYEVVGTTGLCSSTESITINVHPEPNVTLTASNTTICTGGSTVLTASGANDYTWDNGLGNGSTHTVSPTSTTTYEVTGTIGSCTATTSITVTVGNNITVSASTSEQIVCPGESVELSATGADVYVWDNGLGSGSTHTVYPTTTTTYQVAGTTGNCSGSAYVTVLVAPTPVTPVISQNGNELSVNLQTGETAEWFLGGVSVGTGSSIVITSDGNYEVVVTNADGCSSSTSGNFQVDTSSLAKNELEESFHVYPNPTENIVTISWSGANRVKGVQLYDAQGRIIQNQIVYDEEGIELDLTRYQTGVYIVRLETENGVYSKKVTKR